jgi:hypothetical protein
MLPSGPSAFVDGAEMSVGWRPLVVGVIDPAEHEHACQSRHREEQKVSTTMGHI